MTYLPANTIFEISESALKIARLHELDSAQRERLERATQESKNYCLNIIDNYDELVDGACAIINNGASFVQFTSYTKDFQNAFVVEVFERDDEDCTATTRVYDIHSASIKASEYNSVSCHVFFTAKKANDFYLQLASPMYQAHELNKNNLQRLEDMKRAS